MFNSRFPNLQVVDEPVYKSELFYGVGFPASLYSQFQDSTPITNTLTESSLIGAGNGASTIAPNTFLVSNAYTVKMGGKISAANGDDITINLKSNGVLLATTGAINLKATTNKVWQLEITFVVRALGAAGVAKLQNHFVFSYEEDASDNFESHAVDFLNTTTFDTTVLNFLEITAQWAQASVSDNIYSTVYNLNKIF